MNSTGRTYNRNDLVTLDSLFQRPGDAGKVWKVTKAPTARNQVNYLIEPVNGGVGLRVKGYMLQPTTEAEQAAAKAIDPQLPRCGCHFPGPRTAPFLPLYPRRSTP